MSEENLPAYCEHCVQYADDYAGPVRMHTCVEPEFCDCASSKHYRDATRARQEYYMKENAGKVIPVDPSPAKPRWGWLGG